MEKPWLKVQHPHACQQVEKHGHAWFLEQHVCCLYGQTRKLPDFVIQSLWYSGALTQGCRTRGIGTSNAIVTHGDFMSAQNMPAAQ